MSTLWGVSAAAAVAEARIMATHLDPASFAKAIMLEAADIPAHMTIAQWRAYKRAELRGSRRTGRRRLRLRRAR
jgi:hypothetical protein